jgi:flagellin
LQFTVGSTAVADDILDTTNSVAIGAEGTFDAIDFNLTTTGTANEILLTADSGTFTLHNMTVSRGVHAALADNDILDTTRAAAAITAVDAAITSINSQRATLGASQNRLEYASDNLANVSQNTSASRSRILDADYASETTELARTQIIQQAATAMLSQANQQAQSVLALLK